MAEATPRFSVRGALQHLFGRLWRRRFPPIMGTLAAVQAVFEGEVAPLPPVVGTLAAVEESDLANFFGKRDRYMPGRDPARLVAREMWPPDGLPPPSIPTPYAIQKLSDEMKKQNPKIPVPHGDTLRAAINRRPRR